jgi:CIC family chloride channel protein
MSLLGSIARTPRRLAEAGERLRRMSAMSEGQRFLLLSILVGVFAGLVVVCFHIAIELLAWNTVHSLGGHSRWRVVLWPPLGAAVSYLLVTRFFPAAKGSGVNNTKAALYISDGYVPARSVPGKFLTSTLSIGSGNPMGPEDPALQMGAGIASLLGRSFRLSRRHMRMVAPTGAAAGIAAAFNTPITGVLFVMEEVVAAWNAGVLGSIVLSAVSGVVVVRWFLGDASLFQVPVFRLTRPSELLIYGLTGIVGGVLSAYFTRYVTHVRGRLLRVKPAWRYLLPVAAGLLVGLAGVWAPEVLGTGYGTIDNALHDGFVWHVLLLFALLKVVTTSVSFCAGTPGGMFAPTLFIGAMMGGGIGGLAHLYWPLSTSPASAYVLVGIGTFFAGVFRAPMTSIFMVFEVSGTYAIILPVMIANTISYLVSRRLEPESLFHVTAHQDGLDLPSVEQQREMPLLCVEDAMVPGPSRLLGGTLSLGEAVEQMSHRGWRTCLVIMALGRWREASLEELEATAQQAGADRRLSEALGQRPAPRLYPDTALDSALRLLANATLLPVSDRANPNRLVGTLSLEDVLEAYGIRESAE